MSDVMVKCECMLPLAPMNGRQYTKLELDSRVDGKAEVIEIVSVSGKALVVDSEAKQKGRVPNRIATGWLVTSGIKDYVAGIALLVEEERLPMELMGNRRRMRG